MQPRHRRETLRPVCRIDVFHTTIVSGGLANLRSRNTVRSLKFRVRNEIDWLGGRDSNPDRQIQNLQSYHWTTSQRTS